MSDLDAALDARIAEQDREAWLVGRNDGFGCSDLGALWIILGWAGEDVCDWHEIDAVDGKGKAVKKWVSNLYTADPRTGERDYVTPRYLWEMAAPMRKTGLPRLIAEKAGLAKPRGQSDAQAEGLHKERQLFAQSRLGQFNVNSYYAHDAVDAMPDEWRERVVSYEPLVIRDAVEPRLRCTVEAWEVTPRGLVIHELKTDRLGLRTRAPWAQRLQALGEATVLGGAEWAVQYGPRWALSTTAAAPPYPDLADPIQWGPFKVTDEERATIRRAAREGWALVTKAMEGRR